MVKKSVGLPDGFDLRVSSEDLMGKPARLSGYLDPAPKTIVKDLSKQEESKPVFIPPVEVQSEHKTDVTLDRNSQKVALILF